MSKFKHQVSLNVLDFTEIVGKKRTLPVRNLTFLENVLDEINVIWAGAVKYLSDGNYCDIFLFLLFLELL